MKPEQIAQAFADAMGETADSVHRFIESLQCADVILTPAPTDPRERALWAKQNRGTGPAPDSLRKRGRTTRYQTR